jgi:hypothetical protein
MESESIQARVCATKCSTMPFGLQSITRRYSNLYAYPREKSIRHFKDQIRKRTSRKPTLWTYEMLCWYFIGMTDEEELLTHIARLQKQD